MAREKKDIEFECKKCNIKSTGIWSENDYPFMSKLATELDLDGEDFRVEYVDIPIFNTPTIICKRCNSTLNYNFK
jgi:hypothetical protein